jgi:hypothetical protein
MYAFDLIELNGDDLRREPLERHKAALARLLARAGHGCSSTSTWRPRGRSSSSMPAAWAWKGSSASGRARPTSLGALTTRSTRRTSRRLRSRGWSKRIGLDHAPQAPVIICLNGGRWPLVEEFVETESGKRNDRPQPQNSRAVSRTLRAAGFGPFHRRLTHRHPYRCDYGVANAYHVADPRSHSRSCSFGGIFVGF